MDWIYPALLAAFLAGLLTYCDLDTQFDPPPSLNWGPWWKLTLAWWFFVLANAALALVLYYALSQAGVIPETNPWLKALGVGLGYSAAIRLKFTTLPINGKDTPIGAEVVYEGLKNLIHKRINRIIREWRMEKTRELAQSDVPTLRQQSKALVISDTLMTEDERKEANKWIDAVASAQDMEDADRRLLLATFILTGQRRSRS